MHKGSKICARTGWAGKQNSFSALRRGGLGAASSQYNLEYIGNSDSKVTLLSIKSFIGNVFSGLAGLAMGMLVFTQSYQEAYLIVGTSLLVVAFLAAIVLKEYDTSYKLSI